VQTAAVAPHRVHVSRVRVAAHRPHRNPLNAFASYKRPRDRLCGSASVCVFDGLNGRWYAR